MEEAGFLDSVGVEEREDGISPPSHLLSLLRKTRLQTARNLTLRHLLDPRDSWNNQDSSSRGWVTGPAL